MCGASAADRFGLRYESDLTDAEWAWAPPLICVAAGLGRWTFGGS